MDDRIIQGDVEHPPTKWLRPRPCTRGELYTVESKADALLLRTRFQLHRKLWEHIAIYRAFVSLHMSLPRCLGFGVGKEPLPEAFAREGAMVLATDQAPNGGELWRASGQYHGDPQFYESEYGVGRVDFRHVDMRSIPADLKEFDFLWSSCALEHIGGIAAGSRFVHEAMRCLKPGGWAIHTTELNVTSNEDTVNESNLCLFRRCDIEAMLDSLRASGHSVLAPAWEMLDDVGPPAGEDELPHLAYRVGDFVTTSFFFATRRGT
jgi:hypothetical protein